MLKKSLFIATLLVSNAFGSNGVSEPPSYALSDIHRIAVGNSPDYRKYQSTEEVRGAITHLLKAFQFLQTNPAIAAQDPRYFIDIAFTLSQLGQRQAAIRIYRFALDANVQLAPENRAFIRKEIERLQWSN